MRDETNHFKVWDWSVNDWLKTKDIESVLQFNLYKSGENEGETWGELRPLLDRHLEIVFADNNGNIKDPRVD